MYTEKASPVKLYTCSFTQVRSRAPSGARLGVFELLKPHQRVLWMASKWEIYAPLLWDLAARKQVELYGLECSKASRYRRLWKELQEAQTFDVWVLDKLGIRSAEIFFLRSLLRSFSVHVILLEQRSFSFCQEQIEVELSHDAYRLRWSKSKKGLTFSTKPLKAPLLESIQVHGCF